MGIYVPNVRLPGDGDFELWIAVKKDGSFTYNVSGGWRDGKQKAVPVPQHGRLIEENDVLAIVSEYCPDDDGSVGKVADLREMLDEIEALPTIIPAEPFNNLSKPCDDDIPICTKASPASLGIYKKAEEGE